MFRIALCLFSAAALLAEAPLPVLRTEAVDAGSVFFVRNTGSVPLTGYVIELVDYPGSYFGLWREELAGKPVAPGEDRRIPTTNMTVGASPEYCKLTAAIYADGSTAGNPERIAQFHARRKHLQATAQSIAAKLKAGAQAADLRQWGESIAVPGKRAPVNQTNIDAVADRTLILEAADQLGKSGSAATAAGLQHLIYGK